MLMVIKTILLGLCEYSESVQFHWEICTNLIIRFIILSVMIINLLGILFWWLSSVINTFCVEV